MEKKLNLTHLGIDFMVTVKLDSNNEIKEVLKVQAWDDNNDKYVKVPCDLKAFQKEMGIFLRGAL